MQTQSAERVGDKVSVFGNVYSEMIDLIAQGGGPASVIAFRPSDAAQEQVYEMIERKRDGTLTPEEANQLLHYTELEHILRMAKIRARLAVGGVTATPTVAN